jgi:hypothetical protein
MTRKIVMVFLVLPALLLAGCIEFEERITLNKDGSGSMEIEYWSLSDLNFNDDTPDSSRDDRSLRESIEDKYTSDKVKLIEFTSDKEEKSHHVRFKVGFEDLMDLNDVPQFHENRIEFKRSGKKMTFRRTIETEDINVDQDEGPSNLFEHFILNIVEEGLSNIKFRFEIETPHDIAKTNATFTPGDRRAVWKFRLSDVMYKNEVELTLETK